MTANDIALTFLGEDKEFQIPFFQRNYVWKQSNWEELLESFEDESLPFLGSIIVKLCTDEHGSTYHAVIDGQQRLTTITILIKAIFDMLPDDKKSPGKGPRKIIEGNLFYLKNATDDFAQSHLKIKHSRVDHLDYEKVIKAGLFDDCPAIDWHLINDNSSAIMLCYKYYCERMSHKSDEELKQLLNRMFDPDKHYFVKILLKENDSNEQRIFDTINRAGVHLSAADIIKNNLFRLLLERSKEVGKSEKDVCDLYDENWTSVFSPNSDVQALWDIKRVFGNVQRTNLEFLLYCYAVITWGQSKDIFSDMDKVYSENLKNLSYNQLKSVVKEIHSYGFLFKKEIIDFQQGLQNIDNDEVPFFKYSSVEDRLLLILERFGVQMFYPYVLKRLMDFQGDYDNPELKRDFGVLESFVIRRRLSGKGVTDYSIKCNQILHGEGEPAGNNIIETLVKDLNDSTSGLTDSDIINYLKKPNIETAKIILFFIELYLIHKNSVDPDFLTYSFTLEHILPQNWKKWSNVPIVDEQGVELECSDDEKQAYRNKAVKSLGNMLLLSRKLNTSISNGTFEDKNKKTPGYQECSKLETTKEALQPYMHGDKVWDEKHIYDRERKLLSYILTIWPNYKELIPIKSSTSKVALSVDDFSAETLADAIKLLNAIDESENNVEVTND